MNFKLTQKEFRLITDALLITGAVALDDAIKKIGTSDYKQASKRAEDFIMLGQKLCKLEIEEEL